MSKMVAVAPPCKLPMRLQRSSVTVISNTVRPVGAGMVVALAEMSLRLLRQKSEPQPYVKYSQLVIRSLYLGIGLKDSESFNLDCEREDTP